MRLFVSNDGELRMKRVIGQMWGKFKKQFLTVLSMCIVVQELRGKLGWWMVELQSYIAVGKKNRVGLLTLQATNECARKAQMTAYKNAEKKLKR